MSREHFEEMLDYYQQEMMYLRRAGSRFVSQYPKIAQNLNLSHDGSSDPHVQRLIESFAFLTAGLQKELDNRYVQFTNTLLGTLYPQFVAPFPSATVASFRLSERLGKATAGTRVPRDTALFAEALEKKTCRFKTVYPVELWPFEVSEAQVMNIDDSPLSPAQVRTQWILRIRVRRYDGVMSELNPSFLRFYISGDAITTNCIYDSIFSYLPEDSTPVYIKGDQSDTATPLPEGALSQVGFKPDEALVPYPPNALDAYRLLHEYFVFPEKFKFFDISNFSTLGARSHVDILLPLADQSRADKFRVNARNFVLGCTPIINLFPKISEPIDLNYQALSYRLVGDQRNEDTTEIYSVQKVVGAKMGGKDSEVFSPYFSYNYDIEASDNGLYWLATRTPSENPEISGTDVSLSFVDYNFSPRNPSQETVYAHTLCTNRDLATYIPAGGNLQVDGVIPSSTISCLTQPSPEQAPSLGGESQWRLISQLSLNYLSLSGETKAALALKELLQLYSGFNRNKSHPEINAIEDVKYTQIMGRKGPDAWRGFVQGLNITLTLNETPYAGQGGYLLANILNEFFSQYVSLNSFTELTLNSTLMEGTWKKWPAHIGKKPLL